MIKLVDFNEIYGKGKGETKTTAKKTCRAGSSKKKAETTVKADEATATEEKLLNKRQHLPYFILTPRSTGEFFITHIS